MSSKRAEDVHAELVKKLLTESGLVCSRTPSLTEESSEEEEEAEEESEYEEEEPEPTSVRPSPTDVHTSLAEEAVAEEVPDVFPTPSLRKLLPERLRRIEAFNRIKVLPEAFNDVIDPNEIPKINYTPPKVYIDKLAELTGCKTYKRSLAEYWFLDTLANLLRRAQGDDFDKPAQAVLILWFCEWMKEMQQFDVADRERMLRRWKDNMLNAARVVGEMNTLPTPSDAGVYYKAVDVKEDSTAVSSPAPTDRRAVSGVSGASGVSANESSYDCSLRDLSKIVHYIYDLMSTDYQYNLVRSIFTFSPEYHLIDGPYQIETPKRLLAPLKPKKEPKPAKEAKPAKGTPVKGVSKVAPDPQQYLHLMRLIANTTAELERQEEIDMEDWNRRNSILPLNNAATPEFFESYWPPPTPEPEPIVVAPTPKGKGKKK